MADAVQHIDVLASLSPPPFSVSYLSRESTKKIVHQGVDGEVKDPTIT